MIFFQFQSFAIEWKRKTGDIVIDITQAVADLSLGGNRYSAAQAGAQGGRFRHRLQIKSKYCTCGHGIL